MPFFFLSYARNDSDGYLDQFYGDLCDAVRARTGQRPEEVGFRDRSDIQLGADWRRRLTRAVVTARVLVAVCSPSYFRSRMCGQEWQLFADMHRHPSAVGASLANLLPILWIPTAPMPDVASRLQFASEDLGELYRQEGLHFLLKFARYRDEYDMFVLRLAERIADVGRAEPPTPPPEIPEVESVPSAFEHPTGHPSTVRATPSSPVRAPVGAASPDSIGPRHVNFVVVAAPKPRMSTVRVDVQFYGPSPHDWAPYLPDSPQRICVFAQGVASENDMTSALDASGGSVLDVVSRAEQQNEVVVLIVDVWATKLDDYRGLMLEYDDRNAPTSAVMVPWSRTDSEIHEREEELRNDLRLAFPKNTARDDVVFRTEIGSLADFETVLEDVLAVTQARIFRMGTVMRRAGDDDQPPQPMLGDDK